MTRTRPILSPVESGTWTFGRNDERLEVERVACEEGMLLQVTERSGTRAYFFDDLTRLVPFQSDMEQFLLKTGWSLLAFSPDRRTGRDRRTFPRLSERRRWWTDGIRNRVVGSRRSGDR